MNKNRYFANNPTNIDIQRSRFNRASQHKTTLNTGDLVPIYVDEMLPGDTIKMDMSALVRMCCNRIFLVFCTVSSGMGTLEKLYGRKYRNSMDTKNRI